MSTTRKNLFDIVHGDEHRALLAAVKLLTPAGLERLERLHTYLWESTMIDAIEAQCGPAQAQMVERQRGFQLGGVL